MNREELVAALRNWKFETYGIDLEIGFMDASLAPIPRQYDAIEGATMSAKTRYAGAHPGNDFVSMLDDVIDEIQYELEVLAKMPTKDARTVERYGVFFYQVPAEDSDNLISYATVTTIRCWSSVGCSHVRVNDSTHAKDRFQVRT